jgi:tetratricopeptide (TPR) repeat protein
VLALNELGVQFLKLGQPDMAIDPLRKAVKIVPQGYSPRLNYGIALLENKDLPNAEEQLRLATKLNRSGASGHLYLGIALATQKKLNEGETELKLAIELGANSMNQAHYYLGGIYWGRREYKKAADELEAYLKMEPQAPNANRIRTTIKELRSKEE